MSDFKIGDRVRYIGTQSYTLENSVGTVRAAATADDDSVHVRWDGGEGPSWVYKSNVEKIEVPETFAGIEVGDRVRFEAVRADYVYNSADLPSAYNGMQGTVESASIGTTATVQWDIPEIGKRGSFKANLVVIERPKAEVTLKITGTDEQVKAAQEAIRALSSVEVEEVK